MIRIGVIGAGGNGRGHASYYCQSPRAQVVAVADPDQERAKAAASECRSGAVSDYHEFLTDVDAVVISSPNHLHREHAVECAGAGKHVYCEKPMGINAAQAEEIAAAVREAGVRCVVGFSVRFSGLIQTMQRMVGEGKVGDLISIWSRRLSSRPGGDTSHWRSDHSLSGGVLFEINVHELDWMMAIGGDVTSVYGRAYAAGQDYERANDHIWVTLNFAGGGVGAHEGSWVCPAHEYFRGVLGTAGALTSADWGRRLLFSAPGEEAGELDSDPRFDLRGHFLDCIEKGVPGVADAEWGRKVMTVADAVLDSALSGQVVEVSY